MPQGNDRPYTAIGEAHSNTRLGDSTKHRKSEIGTGPVNDGHEIEANDRHACVRQIAQAFDSDLGCLLRSVGSGFYFGGDRNTFTD